MENNKREWPPVRRPRRRGVNIRPIALMLALVLLVGAVVGGTIAWLTDKTDDVQNTFTTSDINITLTETKSDFKMIPGYTIEKDPVVTVEKGSEDAWIFIKVEKSDNLDSFITYKVDPNNWTELETGVYYTKYESRNDVDIAIKVLEEQKVTVKDTVTKEMMNDLEKQEAVQPTLTFTAYACQYWKDNDTPFTPAEAWANAKG